MLGPRGVPGVVRRKLVPIGWAEAKPKAALTILSLFATGKTGMVRMRTWVKRLHHMIDPRGVNDSVNSGEDRVRATDRGTTASHGRTTASRKAIPGLSLLRQRAVRAGRTQAGDGRPCRRRASSADHSEIASSDRRACRRRRTPANSGGDFQAGSSPFSQRSRLGWARRPRPSTNSTAALGPPAAAIPRHTHTAVPIPACGLLEAPAAYSKRSSRGEAEAERR